MGAKRPDIDWVEVQACYMADQISTREIARRYGVTNAAIIARAKKEGWTKDLSQRVATGVRDAVFTSYLPPSEGKQRRDKQAANKQADIVRAAIEDGKLTVLRHIEVGRLLGDNSRKLAKLIRQKIKALQAAPENMEPGLLFTLARAHEAVTRATANTIQIERQARNLDDQPADPSAPASIQIVYYRSDLNLTKVGGNER